MTVGRLGRLEKSDQMADVFISYSKADRELAEELATFLADQGYSVWWDRNLKSGEKFRREILRELARSRAVIVIWTGNSVVSDWVVSEASRAYAEEKLVGLKIDHLDYHEVPPPFDNLHLVSATAGKDILEGLEAIFERPARPSLGKRVSMKAGRLAADFRNELVAMVLFFISWISFLAGPVLVLGVFQEDIGTPALKAGVVVLAAVLFCFSYYLAYFSETFDLREAWHDTVFHFYENFKMLIFLAIILISFLFVMYAIALFGGVEAS